jgi:hypothetical protein
MLPLKDPEENWDQMVGPDKTEADTTIRMEKNIVKHNNYI